MLFPYWLVVWLTVAGISALILGARSAGILLLTPGIIRFGILPLLPEFPDGAAQIFLLAAVPFVAVFGGILLLKRAVDSVYGRHAGGFVAGTYLVRTLDAFGEILGLAVVAALIAWIWAFVR